MNFLSVVNNLDVSDSKDVLQYNKATKELTFISPEDGSKHTCYVNSMQALVNFMREYVAPITALLLGGRDADNVSAAVVIFITVTGEYANRIASILHLEFVDDVPDFKNTSYMYWLKAAIDGIQVLDTLEKTEGLWNGLLQVKQLDTDVYVRIKIVTGQPATINWGDGEHTETDGTGEDNHLYKTIGNYTITYKGLGLPTPQVEYQISGKGEFKGETTFHFWTHQSLN